MFWGGGGAVGGISQAVGLPKQPIPFFDPDHRRNGRAGGGGGGEGLGVVSKP